MEGEEEDEVRFGREKEAEEGRERGLLWCFVMCFVVLWRFVGFCQSVSERLFFLNISRRWRGLQGVSKIVKVHQGPQGVWKVWFWKCPKKRTCVGKAFQRYSGVRFEGPRKTF